jgi:hypothetical protein
MNFFSQLKNRLDLIEDDAAFEDMILEEIQQQLLLEKSPLLKQFGQSKSGQKLAKFLHKNFGLSNSAEMRPYKHVDVHGRESRAGNLNLKNFKTHYDNFYILHGENGWAAFKPDVGYLRKMLRLSGLEKTDTQVDLPDVEPRAVPGKDECNDPKAIQRKIKDYNPMHDDCLPYTAVFSLINDKGEPTVKIIDTTRGGSYLRKEKSNVERQTAADAIKDVIGHKNVKVYVLDIRDDPREKSLPPEMFSGKAGKKLGKAGASVQRRKGDVRTHGKMYQDLENVPSEVAYNSITKKFLPILPKLLSRIEQYLEVSEIESKELANAKTNLKAFADSKFKEMVKSSLGGTWVETDNNVAREIADFKKKNPEFNDSDLNVVLNLAAKGNRVVLSRILKDVRREMSNYFQAN